MRTSSTAGKFCRTVVLSVVGLVLTVGASAPVYADSARSEQWHLDAMKADDMWRMSTGAGVTVAVIDSGVDATNPDLTGQVLKGLNLETELPGDELSDYDGHGTGMAGLIAGTGQAAGGNGAFGLAPGSKVLPIRMAKATRAATQAEAERRFNEDLPKAIRFAVDHGAKVINISLGMTAGSEQVDESVRYALKKGALIFAAVGNSGHKANLVEYPAGTPGVVGVGAIGKDLQKTEESQWGAQVDLSAPGEEMVHACGGKTGFCESHGTSDASALASASAALIWSKYPDWTNNQVLRIMLNTAGKPTSGAERNDYVGYGAVRPGAALTKPGDPGPADEFPLPDLAAAASPSPSAEPSKAVNGSEGSDVSEKPAAVSPAVSGGSSNVGLWVGLGVGAVVLVGAGVAFGVVRSRRRGASVSGVSACQPAAGYQQVQPPYPPFSAPGNLGASGMHSPYGSPPHQGGDPAA
ncbi:type VII secretion-associated serine protease mycosin [Streptomyces sp. BpilaLS-43]|uniref:type VII secretion-associated serine protease mycosin n=1 Tax=Streptomyces sp. BpilaLS-43 TaxID=1839778 RepID=UPI00081AF3D6|nr:type VII secretion-associated serine protease mycosin [Streptomyces sp. BpilaLS-43]SCD60990.1 type VII secretion-associated serine protease mycosin [Streptomyces sp. BpilaLS-43]